MSQKEKIKALIDFYKAIIIAFMTALFGVLGYTFINYKHYTIYDAVIVLLCLFGIVSALMIFVRLFLKEINKLAKEKE